jgi:hypothetical protein
LITEIFRAYSVLQLQDTVSLTPSLFLNEKQAIKIREKHLFLLRQIFVILKSGNCCTEPLCVLIETITLNIFYMDNNLDPSHAFKEELLNEIRKRKKYEDWDFKLAHFFLWLSIFASFSSAIIIAAGDINIPKILVAIIAGVPGLVVVIDKSFDFARRTAWDTMYKIDMQELQDDVDYGKMDTYKAAKRLREISRRHESAFLKIGFFAKDKDEKLAGNSESGNGEQDPKKDVNNKDNFENEDIKKKTNADAE